MWSSVASLASAFVWKWKCSSLSRVWLSVTWWTVTHQALLSMEVSRQEYLSGLHALIQGIFPTQRLNPDLLHCRQIPYWLSYQGRPDGRHDGISVLKRIQRCSFSLSCENTGRSATYKPGTEPLPRSWPCSHFHLGLSASKLWEINVCCLRHLVYGILL